LRAWEGEVVVVLLHLLSFPTVGPPNSIVQSFLEECLCVRKGLVMSRICELFIEFVDEDARYVQIRIHTYIRTDGQMCCE
jgi:hypothetical protein